MVEMIFPSERDYRVHDTGKGDFIWQIVFTSKGGGDRDVAQY
jgi:hypothetical protein